MRIRRFELRAFGPFTDLVLDFPGDRPGLHVIHGPNEAGKSSILRALTAWLYGFEERTRDNFLHPNDQLLVAGLLEGGQGEELYFARRKRRKNDLLDSSGAPLAPARLSALLHGIDQLTFKKLFGLDHQALVQGGAILLEEQGSAAATLFAAGTGIGSLRQVLAELREESEQLYKGRASKPALNAALRSLADLRSEINRLSLSGQQWKEQEQRLRLAQQELERAQQEQRRLDREHRRLDRLRQALSPLGRLRELRDRLAAVAEVPDLPEDFPRRRAVSQDQLRAARQTLAAARSRLHEFQRRAEGIEPEAELLAQSDTVNFLHQRLGEYRKGMIDRPLREGERVQAKTEAARLLRRIRPDLSLESCEELRPLLRRRRAIRELGEQLPLLREKSQAADQRCSQLLAEQETARTSLAALPAVPDLQPLKAAVAGAQGLGGIDRVLELRGRELAAGLTGFSMELERLSLWSGTPEELVALSLPLEETVSRFVTEAHQLADQIQAAGRRREELDRERKRLILETRAMEQAGELPTERELEQLRSRRDQGWQLVRRQWLGGENLEAAGREYHPDLSLPEAYEQAVLQADGVADRLRREAERVHKYAHLLARQEALAVELQELVRREEELARREAGFAQRWRELWQPWVHAPLAPAEMAGWLARLERLRGRARQLVEEKAALTTLAAQRQGAVRALAAMLPQWQGPEPAGEELAPVLLMASALLERHEMIDLRRQSLEERLDDLAAEARRCGQEAERAREALEGWQRLWEEVLRELGLSTRESPAEAEFFFEGLEACLLRLDQADDFRKRIAGIDRDAAHFVAEVQDLLQRVAPGLLSLPVAQAVEKVSASLSRARAQEATLRTYRDGMAAAEDEIRQATAQLEAAGSALKELCVMAHCGEAEELEAAERRWQERLRLQERIREEEERLLLLADGQQLQELEAQAAQVDPDVLPGQLREISEALDRLSQRLGELAEGIGMARSELARMNGSSAAAAKAEEAEEKLSEIRRLAERYACLRLAAGVLEEEMDRYRAAHQDPVLELAGRYFAGLTRQSFAGVRIDIDEKGEQVIVGIRQDGRQVSMEGMSDGTRDQLFLALRLASLEHRLERSEPMPFVVDDILINFDEARAEATLQALGELAAKNQVILFCHHRHLPEYLERSGLGQVITLRAASERSSFDAEAPSAGEYSLAP